MRKHIVFILLFSLLAFSIYASTPLNGVVAIVNDDVITQTEYDHALTIAQHQLAAHLMSVKEAKIQLNRLLMKQKGGWLMHLFLRRRK